MATRKNVMEEVCAASLVLLAHNSASATERNVGLRLAIDLGRHCIRHTRIKVFSDPHFPIYGQNPRTYTGKYVSEKTHKFA